ncbi:putative mycofactocin radical SAM maturase MftC [subsurface metagenome]|nr:radical SAM protein [Hadesarchaea archaeon]
MKREAFKVPGIINLSGNVLNRKTNCLQEEIAPERRLEHIDIEITKKCNLFCLHCSARSDSPGRELSLKEIKIILDNASSLGMKNVGFTGGEPLVRRNKLFALLKYCKHTLNSKTHLHTNGTLLKSKDAAMMTRLVDRITVTLFGSKPETHDGVTSVKGSLKAAEEGLRKLVRQSANVRTFVVPMKPNYREIPQILKKVHEIGCRKIRILTLSPTGRARIHFENLSLDSNDVKWLNGELIKARNELDIDIDAGFCTQQYYSGLGILEGHQSCLAAENRVHIDAFGEVFPCTASSGLQLFSAGNLRKCAFNLSDIWKFSPVFQFIRFFHSNPPNKCRGCAIYQRCMGGCRVMMHYKYGDITAAKSNCNTPKLFPAQLS